MRVYAHCLSVRDYLQTRRLLAYYYLPIEQEITGDVLLDLDANVLKTEIGIAAFGKRARIINAIGELRRPLSMESERQPTHMPTASRSQSITYSHHSHTPSMQSSAHQSFTNSPLVQNGSRFSPVLTPQSSVFASPSAPPLSAGVGSFLSVESSPGQADYPASSGDLRNGWRASDPGSVRTPPAGDREPQRREVTGLGLGFPSYPPTPSLHEQPIEARAIEVRWNFMS